MRDRSNKSGRAGEAGEKPAWPAGASVFIVAEEKHQDSPEQAAEAETRLQDVWRVVVLNDPVNLMSYVVMVF
jgi:hypothetical protein